MTPEERLKVLEEVFTALTHCATYHMPGIGLMMKREDVSKALASLNGGKVPSPK